MLTNLKRFHTLFTKAPSIVLFLFFLTAVIVACNIILMIKLGSLMLGLLLCVSILLLVSIMVDYIKEMEEIYK